jgi:2-polyprenyl-3-methyl-5-hydroxy-6-metoxy-1,4-benzoquinol methylase
VTFPLAACPLCACDGAARAFERHGYQIYRCPSCRLDFLHPQPSDEALAQIYTQDYPFGPITQAQRIQVAEMKKATARLYLQALLAYHGRSQGKLLEIGCGRGDFLAVAQGAGFEVSGLDRVRASCEEANRILGQGRVACAGLEDASLERASLDVCVMFDVIEHVREPLATLAHVAGLLKEGGTLFVVTPSLDSFSARLLGRHWMEYKPEHLFYFNGSNMCQALAKSGFGELSLGKNTKVLTLDYLQQHFHHFPVPILSPLVALAHAALPHALVSHQLRLTSSGMNVFARRLQSQR